MTEKISDKLVRDILTPKTGNKIIYDTEIKGFGIRVTAAGVKSFVLNYHIAQRERRMTIGQYPAWTVAAAREEAKRLKRLIDTGVDPLGDKQTLNNAPTVKDLWTRYKKDNLIELATRSQKDTTSMWEKDILPALGSKKVAQVTSTDVDALHRSISRRAKVRANRILESFRHVMKLAARWGWIDKNPAEGFHRNQEQPKERFLNPDELVRVFSCLDTMTNQKAANAIRLLILTGARRGEVLGADWSQFDLITGYWDKPSSHTKQNRRHKAPLSEGAITLLKAMKEENSEDLLFPTSNGTAMQDLNRPWKALREAANIPGVRIHDIRHTYASLLISSGQPIAVIGQLLGHTQHQTTMRYAHLSDDPLRAAANSIGALTRNGKAS